jgi:glycerol uptake facilitator-like aquaporin
MIEISPPLGRRLLAEGLGTALLVATVVGSGIMAECLADGNQAIALLGNTIPTGAILVVIITILGPAPWHEVIPYVAVQCLGGIAGTAIAHLMFDLAPFAIGTTARSGASQWFAEAVATFTLIVAIFGGLRYTPQAIPWLVGLTIMAAYWFTSSTSFANPAVTLARGLTTTFAGIAINHVPGFVVAQLIGAAAATLMCTVLFPTAATRSVGAIAAGE